MITLYSTTPSIVDMRDALLLVIPVGEDTVFNPVYVYMITLSGNAVNKSNYLGVHC
jgi:hypothetical protein